MRERPVIPVFFFSRSSGGQSVLPSEGASTMAHRAPWLAAVESPTQQQIKVGGGGGRRLRKDSTGTTGKLPKT
jgi:hypothetical protein